MGAGGTWFRSFKKLSLEPSHENSARKLLGSCADLLEGSVKICCAGRCPPGTLPVGCRKKRPRGLDSKHSSRRSSEMVWKQEKDLSTLFSKPWPPKHLVGKAKSWAEPDMHRNERICVQIRDKSFQHLQNWCQGVNIWKPQLGARSLFEKEQILEQMPVRYRGKKWGQGLQELAIQECSRNLIALFLVKGEKENKRTFRVAFIEAGCSGFAGELGGQMLQGYWSQCQMREQSGSDTS